MHPLRATLLAQGAVAMYGAYTYYAYYGSGNGDENGRRGLLGRIRQLTGRSG